jgi:DNA (cytosine-5)-methyltransferase 1
LEAPDGAPLDRFELAEAGRLQTFPADYPWSGKDRSQQIGNAIPPRLAAHVLAAALGWRLDEKSLDAAVEGEWQRTRTGVPSLAERMPATELTPTGERSAAHGPATASPTASATQLF